MRTVESRAVTGRRAERARAVLSGLACSPGIRAGCDSFSALQMLRGRRSLIGKGVGLGHAAGKWYAAPLLLCLVLSLSDAVFMALQIKAIWPLRVYLP